MLVLEYAFHRQRAIDAGTGEIDIVGRPIGSLEPSALRAVEDSEAPGLQPAAVLKTHMDTVGLRLLAQRSLEQRDYAVEFAVLVDFRQGGMDCQDTNEGAQRGDIRLETAERVGAGGVHPGRGAAFAEASKVTIWITMRQAASTAMNAMTAPVIAILKLNMRECIAATPEFRSSAGLYLGQLRWF